MRYAFAMLGVLTTVMAIGVYIAFHDKVEAPTTLEEDSNKPSMSLSLTSPAFEDNGLIPTRFTCDGENASPELHIRNVPEGTESFILVMDDPDIPDTVKQTRGIEKFDHWVLYNIPADTRVITEGATVGVVGMNSVGGVEYRGPCPPDREHRYIFRLYAVSGTLNFIQTPTLDEVETAAQSMVLDSATLIGRYNRPGNVQ